MIEVSKIGLLNKISNKSNYFFIKLQSIGNMSKIGAWKNEIWGLSIKFLLSLNV